MALTMKVFFTVKITRFTVHALLGQIGSNMLMDNRIPKIVNFSVHVQHKAYPCQKLDQYIMYSTISRSHNSIL